MNREKLKPGDEIVKMRIPKENRMEWIKILQEGGYTQEEFIRIISHLCKRETSEEKLEEFKEIFKEETGREMTSKEESDYRRLFEIFEKT